MAAMVHGIADGLLVLFKAVAYLIFVVSHMIYFVSIISAAVVVIVEPYKEE